MIPAGFQIRKWRADPVEFVLRALGASPDAWQAEVLSAATLHNRIALKASKGPGKTTVLAWLAWWFLLTRKHPKVVATSISGDNLKDNLWTELAKWQARSELLKNAFSWRAERIVAKDHPETWWASARSWSQGADATQQADTLAGTHGDHVMFLIDESGGMPDAVLAAAEAGLANADPAKGTEAILVQAGNPTQLSGPLYRACTRERNLWWVKEISGDPDDPNRAPRVSVQWAREQIEKYGRDNPWVLVNVFGKFPPGQSNTLIGADEANESAQRFIGEAEYRTAPKVVGVDVARFGDDRSVIQCRQGRVAMQPKVFRNISTMELAGQVAFLINRWSPDAVLVDQTGVGAGVVDRLRELKHVVIGIDSSSKPLRSEPKFLNRRAEMWWETAEWIRSGGCVPNDGELISELTTPTYRFDSSGRLQLESKADMKRRGVPSPDKADALALTFAMPVASKAFQLPGLERKTNAITDYDPFETSREANHYDAFEGRP